MSKIAVVGAGPAGCIVSFALVKAGYDVTLYSDRTPDQWLNHSRPTGSAYLFDEVIDIERTLGMDHWSATSFRGAGFLFDGITTVGADVFTMSGRNEFGRRGAAIDQRMRTSRWVADIEGIGGHLVIESVTLDRLDEIASTNDLTILAAGKADLGKAIDIDWDRAQFDKPQRNLAMAIVRSKNGHVRDWFADRVPFVPVKFNRIDDAGEYFWVPYEHKTAGATMSILLEARPGGIIDRFKDCASGQDVVDAACSIIRDTAPWESHIADDMEYVGDGDDFAWLTGRFPPTVRKAFGRTPSGGLVAPVGDTAISFDPICGQGGQFANRSAQFMAERIIANDQDNGPIDEAFLLDVNRSLWVNYGKAACAFNNHFLEPADESTRAVMATAGKNPMAGDAFFNGFARPDRMVPILKDPAAAASFHAAFAAQKAYA